MQPIRKAVDFVKPQTSTQIQQIEGANGGHKQGPSAAVDTSSGLNSQEARNFASIIGRATPTNGAPKYNSNADSQLFIVETSYDIMVPVKYRIERTDEENQVMDPQRVS